MVDAKLPFFKLPRENIIGKRPHMRMRRNYLLNARSFKASELTDPTVVRIPSAPPPKANCLSLAGLKISWRIVVNVWRLLKARYSHQHNYLAHDFL